MEIVGIGGLISLPKLFCEKNVLVYQYFWNRWVKFFKNLSYEIFMLWPMRIGGIFGGQIFFLCYLV